VEEVRHVRDMAHVAGEAHEYWLYGPPSLGTLWQCSPDPLEHECLEGQMSILTLWLVKCGPHLRFPPAQMRMYLLG
jgi:hypothetical protein